MPALTATSTLMCPHGGTVQVSPTNTRALAGGAPVLTASDGFAVVGCAFTLPGPTPSPCVVVSWVGPDKKSKLPTGQTLSTSSIGLCLAATGAPQGTAVVVAAMAKTTTL